MSLEPSPLKSWVLVRGGLAGAAKAHAAPKFALSSSPPMITVLRPSAESATELPCPDSPTAPVPTSLLPCWVHTPLLRVNTQAAPT